MGTKAAGTKVRQKWEPSGIKVGTRTHKWDKNVESGQKNPKGGQDFNQVGSKGRRTKKVGHEWEPSGNKNVNKVGPKWEDESRSGTRMGTKWEEKTQKATRMGTKRSKWEDEPTSGTRMRTKWDQSGNKTRAKKVPRID